MNDPSCKYLSTDLHDELLKRWNEPHRCYHTIEHLKAVLSAVDTLEAWGAQFDRQAVELAAWFHDAVYVVSAPDNEERSAALALEKISDPVVADEVARLVRVTADHLADEDDFNAATLCDADLSVMAGTADEYAVYASRVRAEYASVPDDLFAAGRAKLLEQMLASQTLFKTDYGRAIWERKARENVMAEVAQLRRSAASDAPS